MAGCGHAHRVMANQESHRDGDPARWRVLERVRAEPTIDEPIRDSVTLERGTLLRHEQSAWELQGCAGFEAIYSMERFHVLAGPHAGRCVEVMVIDAKPGELVLPSTLQVEA
jgi:hypothetical protein